MPKPKSPQVLSDDTKHLLLQAILGMPIQYQNKASPFKERWLDYTKTGLDLDAFIKHVSLWQDTYNFRIKPDEDSADTL